MHSHQLDDDNSYPPLIARRPKTSIPKTIGVLNIVFGSLLLLCSVCYAASLSMQSAMAPMFAGQQAQFQEIQEAERRQKLLELERLEQAAENEIEKADIQAKHKALKDQPLLKMPDMGKFMQESSFQAYGMADVATALVLNILMVASGIGLVSFREWGRRLAIWVAVIKIVRLLVLSTVFISVVVPNLTKAFTGMFQEMFNEMAKNPPPGQHIPGAAEIAQMGSGITVMYTASAIGMLVLGIIYPVIVLILLLQPRVKTACAGAAMAGDELPRE